MGMIEEAIDAYRRVSREFEAKDVPVPHRLLAQFEISRALEAAGLRVEAAHGHLDLYEKLLREPSCASGSDSWEFFLERTRDALAALLGSGQTDPEHRQRFEALRHTDARRERERQFRLDLEGWIAQRIEWEVQGRPPEPGRFVHTTKLVNGEPLVVAFTRLAGDAAGGGAIAGFRMDLGYIKSKVLLPHVIEEKLGTGALTTVLDRNGRPVLPLEVSNPGVPDDSRKYALIRGFPSILDFWQLAILDRGNEGLLAVARNQEFLITSLLALTIAVMLGGLYLTLRAVNRELELSRLKSDFVSNVSHELKTPLTLIRMFAETLLLGRAKSREKEREYYRIITRESERLTQLIDNVLDFSRIESGRKQYQFAVENVREIVRTTVESYRDELEQHGFRVHLDVAETEMFAKMDQSAIAQALLNLLSNAEKYSKDPKEVSVSVRTDEDEVRIAVSDRGIGICQADQARIFEKFYRANDDFVRSVRGSGLGLSIANHTLESHGGRIEVESELGRGSTFTLVLPLCTEEGLQQGIPPVVQDLDRAAGPSTGEEAFRPGEVDSASSGTGADLSNGEPKAHIPKAPTKDVSHAQ
jgi:signal transduction histidine kinase